MASLDVYFPEDLVRMFRGIVIARGELTTDEQTLLAAICAALGLNLRSVLDAEPPVTFVVIDNRPARRLR